MHGFFMYAVTDVIGHIWLRWPYMAIYGHGIDGHIKIEKNSNRADN